MRIGIDLGGTKIEGIVLSDDGSEVARRRVATPPGTYDDILLVGSAQAIGYFAALVTLVAPAGLGVRDAAFAWAVKAALPGRSFAVGSLISIAAGVLVIAVVEAAPAIAAGTLVFSIGMSLLFPALFGLTVNRAPAAERSHAVGTFSLFFDLSQGVGAPLLGLVVFVVGTDRSAFVAAALIALTGLVVARTRLPAHT